jgi:hypothetical protein
MMMADKKTLQQRREMKLRRELELHRINDTFTTEILEDNADSSKEE